MNGTKKKSRPSVSSAGTNSTARMSHPRKKFRTLKTTATSTAVPALRMRTDGSSRASTKIVAASTAMWMSAVHARKRNPRLRRVTTHPSSRVSAR